MVSVKIHKPSISFYKSNKIYEKEKIIHNNLISKYSKFEYSYSLVSINNLIFNEHCLVVARFKDFLILDDMTEFLRRFYNKKELKRRLGKIFNFYESYSKIFPNYMILPESQYLYRNIRKKQKMIDAFNQIKKEEEENRNSLKKELNNKEKKEIMIFNKSIQESINRYRPSETSLLFNSIISGFIKNNNNFYNDSNLNSVISIYNNNNNNLKSQINSFDHENNEITLNSENSLKNIVQILSQKFNTNNNNNNTNSLNKLHNNNSKNNNHNNNSKNKNNHKIINNNNDKSKKIKNKNIKETKIKTIKKANQNNTKIENINNSNPKKLSPDHNQVVKSHIHQKSSLNNNNNINNKKFISHKQAVSVSNNNNTIKIINNINNIIINDGNINKEMVININTNYFELNNANINTINTINKITDSNGNIHKNYNNALIKNVKKIKSKTKSKETSLSNKKDNIYYSTKRNSNVKTNNNFINNRLEEKRINTYSNHILNNINYDNNIINNNVINIHNNTASNNNKTKSNQSKIRKQMNENKNIKGIYEYKALNINNISNTGNLYNNKNKKNNIQREINKKGVTIEVVPIEKNKKSQSKKKDLIGTGNKKTTSKPIFNTKTLRKRTLEVLNTEGNINYDLSHFINSNTYYHNYTEHISNNNLNNNKNIHLNNNDKIEQIKTKLNKKIMSRKQKTNSFQINNKNNFFSSFNNYKQTKDSKRNNISNTDNFINYYVKNYTQSLDLDNIKTKKTLNSIEKKDNKENKFKKISAKEMKEKYHKFMQGNKFIHGSYDTSNRLHLFKKFSTLYNSHDANNTNNNNNITEISQRKILDIKSPFKVNNLHTSPGSKVSNKNINDKTPNRKKIQINKKENTQEKNKYFIYKINGVKNKIFISDANNKKMKFVKK